jgi:two-component system, chemotaxis family, CheB/CheR fusion protein
VSDPEPDSRAQDFLRLIDYLKSTRGFDFSGYKVPSLMRRVQKRMHDLDLPNYAAYIDYLEVHPDEFEPLFNTVLINVTAFFRDPPAWEYLAEHVLPRILEHKRPDDRVRCWSAGCASGEEAYTLAILLAEALGEHGFRHRVKIYATDADDEALNVARQGSYTAAQVHGVSPEMLAKYFERNGERYVFRSDLRRCLIFGRHNLVQDAAISHLDLLICRNTLMYFNAEAQERILARFHFALNPVGYLFLGRAETLLTHSNNFRPVDLKRRIFQRTAAASLRDRLLATTPVAVLPEAPPPVPRHLRLREAAFEFSPLAQIVVDRRGQVVAVSEKAGRLFGLGPGDVGRPLQDLEISYRPAELRSQIETAYAARTSVTLRDVEFGPAGSVENRFFEVQITPLFEAGAGPLGVSISFQDLTVARQLRAELERANQELETAYEELQSANEELETTNEELQSTIEELETTNEELQSANEELETMNEELQSTNEELRTMNEQLHQGSSELDLANRHLRSILASLSSAVVVLDEDAKVEIWSDKAQELWGLRSDEVLGQLFTGLDMGLPVQELRGPIQSVLRYGSGHEVVLDAINRRGRPVRCQVVCTPLGDSRPSDGVILLIDELRTGDGAAGAN